MLSEIIIAIGTGFHFEDMSYHSWMSIVIAIIFTVILWVSFLAIIDQFKNESREELKN